MGGYSIYFFLNNQLCKPCLNPELTYIFFLKAHEGDKAMLGGITVSFTKFSPNYTRLSDEQEVEGIKKGLENMQSKKN